MVPLTGQNTINDMVDRINEVTQEIQDVAYVNANAVMGPASSSADQIMAFSDATGKKAKAANISPFAYSLLDDVDGAAARATLGLKSAAVLDAATAATANTAVQRDASGNITGVGITATSGFVGNGSQITSLNMSNAASGTLDTAYGGTGTTTATGTGSVVKSASPTLTGTPLSTTASADTNTTQIATTAFVISQASSASPTMNGTATVGTSLRYARADHMHPSDTSKVNTSLLGVANGVATLDSGGKVPTSQLPAYVDDVLEYTNLASFPATGETGKIYVALDTNKTYRWSGSAYIYITSGAVDSVAGKTGVVTLVKGDVGLGNVDNTSDANKPVSTAQQSALDLKAALASPALTGVPIAPTAAVGTNTTQLATTAFVQAEIANDAPTKTGTGASGDWGISVTGNAATATNLKPIIAGTTGAGTAANWYEVCNWVLGAQYNNFAARFALTGRGNSSHYDELHIRGEFSTSTFGVAAFEIYSVEGISDSLIWAMTFNNATKTARLYMRRAGTDFDQTILTPLAHYTSGATFNITNTLFGTTPPTGDTVITRDSTNAKRIYHDGYKPSADKLQTARTINGVSFDGTANINIEDRLGTAIAAAATTTIGTAGLGDTIHISGTTTITSFGVSTTGTRRTLIFLDALTLTFNSTSMIIPGAANFQTTGGTCLEVVCIDGANGYWRVVSFVRPTVSPTEYDYLDGVTSNLQTQLNSKAALASPALTGVPIAPTAAVGTNTTQLATTAYTVAEIDSRAPTKTGTGASGTWGISVTGNAATATKLASAKTINGVAFDGTDNITVADSTKQPLDATLTTLANLTTAKDKLPYFTGVDAATTTDITSFGRSLIDDADASTARTTLGLGTSAVEDTAITSTAHTVVKRGSDGRVEATRLTVGAATDSSNKGVNYSGTFGANKNGYGVFTDVFMTDATLTGDRALVGGNFVAEQSVNSAEAFSVTSYGLNVASRSSATAGGWSVTGEGNYYGINAAATYQSGDATYKYIQSVFGIRSQAVVNTAATAVAANAYAFHGAVQNLTAGATITNGYGLYLAYNATGTVTNKWSIYSSSSAWVGYHAGEMRIGGSPTQTPRATLDVVGDLYHDSIALGTDVVNIDNITANGLQTKVTSNTTGTFNVFQPKTGVLVTYADGTNRMQFHYPDNGGIWLRNKPNTAAYTAWVFVIDNENPALSAGSCTFSGNGAITMLRNTGRLVVGRDSAGVYTISGVFGTMASNMPAVAMTNAGGRVNMTQAGNGTNLKLTVYGYNNTTASDTTYLNVILGN